MPPNEISQLIDDVVREDLSNRLKSLGYRKTGRTFFAKSESRTAVVNIQANKYNLKDKGTFTINLGVYYPEVAKITNALPVTGSSPKEYDCTIRRRIGVLMNGSSDFWWSITPDSDLVALAADVGNAWSQFGVPWIERVSDLNCAKSELIDQRSYFVAAGIALLQGHLHEAADLIRQAEFYKPHAASRVREWARAHALV